LNESASIYLNNKPIENEFSKFSTQILEKIDDIALNLENELHSELNKKYPKYTASIPYSKVSLIINKKFKDKENSVQSYLQIGQIRFIYS
jgi:hypothetical protein